MHVPPGTHVRAHSGDHRVVGAGGAVGPVAGVPRRTGDEATHGCHQPSWQWWRRGDWLLWSVLGSLHLLSCVSVKFRPHTRPVPTGCFGKAVSGVKG